MSRILILRPEPGAARSAARAERLGMEAAVAPIFSIHPVPWERPDGMETVLLTSANAARHGGEGLRALFRLPCYAVGDTTGEAVRAAGFTDVRAGPSDGAALVEMMAGDGVTAALHLCGRDHVPLNHPAISITRRIVYESEPVAALPAEALAALRQGTLALLHSPRTAAHFAALVDAAALDRSAVALAAISEAAASAAGQGWKSIAVAAAPRDEALLELAVKLCQTARAARG